MIPQVSFVDGLLHLYSEVWRFGAEGARGSEMADEGDAGECGMAAGG